MINEKIFKKNRNNKKNGSYMACLVIAVVVILLLPGVALAETVNPNLTGYHFWQLQQGLTGAIDAADGTSVPVTPVTAPITGNRTSDLKNGAVVSAPIETSVGKTTKLVFDIQVSNNIIVSGTVDAGGLVPGTYIKSLDVFLEIEEIPGTRVKFLDRNGNPVRIPVISEATLVTQSSLSIPIYTILNVSPHEMLDKNTRWAAYLEVESPGSENTAVFNGYKYFNGWLSACTSTLYANGLTAESGLVLSNITVDGNSYSLPDGLNTYMFSRPLGDLSSATVTADVYAASAGTYNVSSLAFLDFNPYTIRDLSSLVTVPFIIANPPMPNNGLTPGYWKNWGNHYNSAQYSELLAGTFVGSDINAANNVFSNYNAQKGMEITILKAHLLACQLTFSLISNPDMPNPDNAYLELSYKINYDGQYFTIGDVINQALAIVANPAAYSGDQIIKVKDMLDLINNL